MKTDYIPGDNPIPIGTTVDYFGSQANGRYVITGHTSPADHPRYAQQAVDADAYPDGTAYDLWPEGMPHKFGLRDHAVYFVRRTSFRVVSETSPRSSSQVEDI